MPSWVREIFGDAWDGVTFTLGAVVMLIFGFFGFNTALDKRIDKRSERITEDLIRDQREEYHKYTWDTVKKGIDESARLASMETTLEYIKERVDKL